jgi:RimJ/RimL family protein N-acetyltransferase
MQTGDFYFGTFGENSSGTHRGHGFAREATGGVVTHALAELGLPRVIAETQATNARSRHLLMQLGFTEVQRLQRFGAEQVILATTAQSVDAARQQDI